MSNETFCHLVWPTNASFKEVSLNCDFTHTFSHDFIHVDSHGTGANNPWGTEFLCQMMPFATLANWCKFQKMFLNCDFLLFFLMISYLYIAPEQ